MTDLKFYQKLADFLEQLRPLGKGDFVVGQPPSNELAREVNNRLKVAQGEGWNPPDTNSGSHIVKLLLENKESTEKIEAKGWWSSSTRRWWSVSVPEADFNVLGWRELRDGE